MRENDKEVLGKTKGGKKIYVQKPEDCAVYKIQFQGGGELPEILSGGFSSIGSAKKFVDAYLVAAKVPQDADTVKAGAKAASKRPSVLKAK